MAIKNKLVVTALLMSFLVMGITQTAQAYTFFIDEFSVIKNGSLLFDDKFNDGQPFPNDGPNLITGGTLSYFVDGTMGSEHSGDPGKLTLNSSGAVPFTFLDGTQFLHQRAILLTDISDNLSLGLKSDDTFSVTGVFDLITPSGLREGYDVMFNDGTAADPTPDDIAMMRVIRTSTNQLMVQLVHLDFVTPTQVIIDSDPLVTTNHTTISLRLEKKDANSNAITGSYAYDNGTFIEFGTTMNIFSDETFTRAEFEAFAPAPVPEPGTMLLLGSGLVGLAGFARKKLKK